MNPIELQLIDTDFVESIFFLNPIELQFWT